MDQWLLMFREVQGAIQIASAGPFDASEVVSAAEIAFEDGYDGVLAMDRKPDLGLAARRVADGRALAGMEGVVRRYVPEEDLPEIERSLAKAG